MLMDKRKYTQDASIPKMQCSCIIKTLKLEFDCLALFYKLSDGKSISISWLKFSHQQNGDSIDVYFIML